MPQPVKPYIPKKPFQGPRGFIPNKPYVAPKAYQQPMCGTITVNNLGGVLLSEIPWVMEWSFSFSHAGGHLPAGATISFNSDSGTVGGGTSLDAVATFTSGPGGDVIRGWMQDSAGIMRDGPEAMNSFS